MNAWDRDVGGRIEQPTHRFAVYARDTVWPPQGLFSWAVAAEALALLRIAPEDDVAYFESPFRATTVLQFGATPRVRAPLGEKAQAKI